MLHPLDNSNPARMWSRCASALAFTLVLAGCNGGGGDSPAPAKPPGLGSAAAALPVTISNPGTQTVYVLVTGDRSQTFAVTPTSATIAGGGSATFQVTNLSAGRIYVSYGQALSSTAPDGANPADPDYHTRFDKVEITYNQNSGGSANLTAVDFYAIPMMLQTSIQGTTINQLTLAPGQTGSGLQAAIGNAVATGQSAPVVSTSANAFARVLAPVKAPAPYGSFNPYLATLTGATLTIAGTYFGSTSQAYNYTGSVGANNITLTSADGAHVIKVPLASLQYNATTLIDYNGIYTCNSAYTVDGTTHHVADNDIYAAVYRDLVAGLNLGYVVPGTNASSSTWWTSPPFPVSPAGNTNYNAYEKVIATNYPGAYGFPFSDRYKQVLADLGGMIDGVTITVLPDATPAPTFVPSGTINPQTSAAGAPTINIVLYTADNNFNSTTFTFDLQSYTGGNVYTFGTAAPTATTGSNAGVINAVPSQNGLNVYTMQLRGKQYSVLANVDTTTGTVVWASIAGGGNATWGAPNLFIGGLD